METSDSTQVVFRFDRRSSPGFVKKGYLAKHLTLRDLADEFLFFGVVTHQHLALTKCKKVNMRRLLSLFNNVFLRLKLHDFDIHHDLIDRLLSDIQ